MQILFDFLPPNIFFSNGLIWDIWIAAKKINGLIQIKVLFFCL